jgi:hypothetical protein
MSMEGMRIAVIQRPPVYGSKVESFDGAAAMAVPGVVKVVEVPSAPIPAGMMPLGGVAVAVGASGVILWTDDGTTWTVLPGPSGLTSANTAAWVEIIERST